MRYLIRSLKYLLYVAIICMVVIKNGAANQKAILYFFSGENAYSPSSIENSLSP